MQAVQHGTQKKVCNLCLIVDNHEFRLYWMLKFLYSQTSQNRLWVFTVIYHYVSLWCT